MYMYICIHTYTHICIHHPASRPPAGTLRVGLSLLLVLLCLVILLFALRLLSLLCLLLCLVFILLSLFLLSSLLFGASGRPLGGHDRTTSTTNHNNNSANDDNTTTNSNIYTTTTTNNNNNTSNTFTNSSHYYSIAMAIVHMPSPGLGADRIPYRISLLLFIS